VVEQVTIPVEADGQGKPPPPIQAEVLVYSASECIDKYSIIHGEYLIGRDVTCQVRLDVEGSSKTSVQRTAFLLRASRFPSRRASGRTNKSKSAASGFSFA
jgi:hypothetical protein